jgi:hypothetical protein
MVEMRLRGEGDSLALASKKRATRKAGCFPRGAVKLDHVNPFMKVGFLKD